MTGLIFCEPAKTCLVVLKNEGWVSISELRFLGFQDDKIFVVLKKLTFICRNPGCCLKMYAHKLRAPCHFRVFVPIDIGMKVFVHSFTAKTQRRKEAFLCRAMTFSCICDPDTYREKLFSRISASAMERPYMDHSMICSFTFTVFLLEYTKVRQEMAEKSKFILFRDRLTF